MNPKSSLSRNPAPVAAFTLLELLTVMAILAIILGFTIPMLSGFNDGITLKNNASKVAGALEHARQLALKESRPIQVRFATTTTTAGLDAITRLQLFREKSNGDLQPVDQIALSSDVVISPVPGASSLSSLEAQSPQASEELPDVGMNYTYRAFSFLPDGGTDLRLKPGSGNPDPDDFWYFTVINLKHLGDNELPANFITIQIDPRSGTLRQYQP